MPKVTRVCRVCGKTYEACRSTDKIAGVFRWQDVACSLECGAEYLRRVNEARHPAPEEPPRAENAAKRKGKRAAKIPVSTENSVETEADSGAGGELPSAS